MSSHLQRIWVIVQEYAKINRENKKNNGKEYWSEIKKFIKMNINCKNFENEIDSCEFIKLENEKTKQIMELSEYELNENGMTIIEINHFMIQTVRIPNENPFSIIKLMQISYNIGQYIGMGGNSEHLARTKIEDFISIKDIQKINMINAYA